MNRTRLMSLVALSFVLYLGASAGAQGVALSLGQLLSLAAAVGLLGIPWLGKRAGDVSTDAQRVGLFCSALSLTLSAWVARGLFALAGELFLSMLVPLTAALVLELAVTSPDIPPRLLRRARPRLAQARWIGAGSALCGLAAALPPVWVFDRALIAPTAMAIFPSLFALGSLAIALVVRLLRRRLGSDAQAVATNFWPLASLAALALLLSLAAVMAARGAPAGFVDAWVSLAAVLLAVGHTWLLSPERAPVAGPSGRSWVANLVAVSIAVGSGLVLAGIWPVDPVLRAASLALFLFGFVAVRSVCQRMAARHLAPDRGRLLNAADEVEAALAESRTLDDLAARVLGPLRRAAGIPEAAPLLYTVHPEREFRLDAAGRAWGHARPLPAALAQYVARVGPSPLVRDDLAALVVRRPELRDVQRSLDDAAAMLALPLISEGELEGVLVVARGARTSALTLEELARVVRLGRTLAAQIAVLSASARAYRRAEEAAQRVAVTAAETEDLSLELQRARDRFNALASERAGRPQPDAAYGPAMRSLLSRLEAVAPQDVPLSIVAEVGSRPLSLARFVHAASGRSAMPFVVVDCAEEASEAVARTLFGDGAPKPPTLGALELADQGTLVLLHVAALPLEVQGALAQVLSLRRARPVGSAGSYPLRARVIAIAGASLSDLVRTGALHEELARFLAAASYQVPPLRERGEDLESLLLLAAGRAARAHGRAAPGLHPEAVRALMIHTWPGNLEELESVMMRAVLASTGPRIMLADLPPLPSPLVPGRGSYLDQEREILQRAMIRAGGNATRAARALGLKRAAFMDKLRRHALDEPGPDTTH